MTSTFTIIFQQINFQTLHSVSCCFFLIREMTRWLALFLLSQGELEWSTQILNCIHNLIKAAPLLCHDLLLMTIWLKTRPTALKWQMSCVRLTATPKTMSLSVRFVVVDSCPCHLLTNHCQCQTLTNWGTASTTWWPVLVKAVHPGKGFVASFGCVLLPVRD